MAAELASTRLRPYLLLTLLCALLYLPGIAALPPLDRDEARFAQATKQMLESGDYVRIRFQDEPRHKKPIGIHWLQAASVRATGAAPDAIWAYRLPSVVGAWLAVLLTYGAGRRLFGRQTALVGAALLGASLVLVAEAHQAKTDAVLLATVVLAQGALAHLYLHARGIEAAAPPGRGTALVFWAAQGAGILVKGPITPVVSLLTVLAISLADRDRRWLRGLAPAWGVPLAAAIAAPWLVAVQLATGGAFLAEAVSQDLLPKLLSGQESHGAPPGTYVAAMLAGFWPGSLLAVPAAAAAWRRRREPAVRFCLAWLLPAWLMFELVPTKLPHYVLPLYPALALVATAALVDALRAGPAATFMRSLAGRAYALLWGALTLAAAAGLAAAPLLIGGDLAWTTLAPAALAAVAGCAAVALVWRGRWHRGLAVLLAAPVVVHPWLAQVAAPNLDRLWLSRSLARTVAAMPAAGTAPLAVAGYHEPSLVFLLGTDAKLLSPAQAGAYLARTPRALAAVSEEAEDGFRQGLAGHGGAARPVERVRGFDYTHGESLTLTLYRAASIDGSAADGRLAADAAARQTAAP